MPSWPLQQSIFAALSTDAALTALIGPGRVYDDVAQASPLPYVTLGPVSAQDWSTGSEHGTEHLVTVHVRSGARGKKQAHEVLGAIRSALHDQPLILAGHHLVNLLHQRSEIRRTPDGEAIHGIARFRAVTEPE
jgi:hypothetical protein